MLHLHANTQGIPPHQNTIANLNEHFEQFGTVISITPGKLANGVADSKVGHDVMQCN